MAPQTDDKRRKRARLSMRAPLSTLLCLLLASTAPCAVQAQCDTRLPNVLLNACPLTQVSLGNGDSMTLQFGSYDWALPFVRRTDGVVQGSFVLRGKGFGANGGGLSVPGPVMRFAKGAAVRVSLQNILQPLGPGAHDVNIHTHGLHVSSDEDNVRVTVNAGDTHHYNYTMPLDHAGGTHWYHPHMHPLSELHSGSGAASMLLVNDAQDGSEIPIEIMQAPEQLLVFQHVHLARLLDLSDGIENDPFSPRTGVADSTFAINMSLAGTGSYANNIAAGVAALKEGLYTVNGFWRPRLELEQGRWYRWRLANTEAVLDLKLALYDSEAPLAVSAQCEMRLIAKDGVYLKDGPRVMDFSVSRQQSIHLHPANRADLMVRCDGPVGSVAELYDNFNAFTNGLVDDAKPDPLRRRERMLSLSVIAATAAAGGRFGPGFVFTPCLPFYMADLMNTAVPTFGGLTPAERTALSSSLRPNYFDRWSPDGTTFRITITPFSLNDAEFGGWGVASSLDPVYRNITIIKIGQVQQFEIATNSRNHPLHIHVNHFQLVNDIADETEYHRRGDWVDTIRPRGFQVALIRFQADTFAGYVPLHCHNHDHSDEGAVAQFYVLDNPLEPDLRVRNIARPWADSCAAPVLLRTAAPTTAPSPAPTRGPSRRPTSSPSLSGGVTAAPTAPTQKPTLKPSASVPTPQPTSVPLIVRINQVANTLYSHAGIVLSSRVESARPGELLQYCWVRREGTFTPELEVAVGSLVTRETCTLTAAEREQLRVVYATSSDGPNLIIRPFSVQAAAGARVNFRYELRVRQGATLTVVPDFFFRVYGFPEPPLLQTNRAQGVAASTTFDFTATAAAGGADPALFEFRFAVERNAAGTEPMSLSGWHSSRTLSQVILPFTQDTEGVSFISVVAFSKDPFGAESRKSTPLFIRLTAPESVEALDVTAGFDAQSAEQTLRAQLAYASVVARAVANDALRVREAARAPASAVLLRQGSLRGGAGLRRRRAEAATGVSAEDIRRTKQLIASAVEGALVLLRESAFSRPMNELVMFVLRELAFGLDAADREVVDTVAELYVLSLALWLNHITAELEAARALNTEPNLAFLIPEGVMAVASEVLSELSALPQLCEYAFSLPELHRVIVDTIFAARLAGQEGFAVALDLLQSVSRKEFAPNAAGLYAPPAGRSFLQLPAAAFATGPQPVYEEVLASVFRAPPRTFCSQAVLVSVLESVASSGGNASTAGRALQATSRRAVQNVVTDVLHLELVRNNASAPLLPTMNATLEVLYYAAPLDGAVSDVVCGLWDEAAQAWSQQGCEIASATGPLEASGTLLVCRCADVAPRADFAAWFLSRAPDEPVPAPADVSAAVFFALAGGLGLLWLFASTLLFARDKRDARLLQRGAVLARVADRDRAGPRPRIAHDNRRRRVVMLRSAFERMRVAPPHPGPGSIKSLGDLCSDAAARHSVLGTLKSFDPAVDRVSRSVALLFAASGALAGVALLDLLRLQSAGSTWRPEALLMLAFATLAHLFAVRALLRWFWRARKRPFHRAPHLRTRALALTPLPPVVDPMLALAGKYGARRDLGSAGSGKRPLSDTERRRLLAQQQQQQQLLRLRGPLSPSQQQLVPVLVVSASDEKVLSVEQEDLADRQASVFAKRCALRALKASHDRNASSLVRALRGVRGALWFVPGRALGGDDGMDRVYGGRARLSTRARKNQRALAKIERDFALRPGVCNASTPLALALLLCALGVVHVTLIAHGARAFPPAAGSVGAWLAQAGIALALATLVIEPLVLFGIFFSCYPTRRGAAQEGPLLAAPRTRFYSWDSHMSTRSAVERRRGSGTTVGTGVSRGRDEDGAPAQAALGARARWRRPSAALRSRRGSAASAASSATAALSRFFPRRATRQPAALASSDEEEDGLAFGRDTDSEGEALTRAAAAAAERMRGTQSALDEDDDDDSYGEDGDDGYETAGESTLAPPVTPRSVAAAPRGNNAGGRSRRPSAMLAAAFGGTRAQRRSAARAGTPPGPEVNEDAPDYRPDDMHYV